MNAQQPAEVVTMKNYEVQVTARASVVVVESPNEALALEMARNDFDFGDFMDPEVSVKELSTEEYEAAYRHADRVSKP